MTPIVSHAFLCRSLAVAIWTLWLVALRTAACELATTVKDATLDDIARFFARAQKRVVTFVGYSGHAALSPCVDYVFYVEDATWGGFVRGSERLSPTSTAMVANSAVVIGIGGGTVARDELLAAKRLGKEVRFIPTDMHHQKARDKAQKKGLPVPTHFGGVAAAVFLPSAQN